MEKQEKTKYKHAAAMKECMKTTPVDRITVTSIVEGAGDDQTDLLPEFFR